MILLLSSVVEMQGASVASLHRAVHRRQHGRFACNRDRPPSVLELREVKLVGRRGGPLPKRLRVRGIHLQHCSAYIREIFSSGAMR
jgi:hypothetical protein